jgi:O-antigen/teichoic acid export membrane protein
VGTAIANVYVSELARRHRDGTGAEVMLFYRVSKNLFWAAIVFGATLAFVAPSVFPLVFGADWAPTGDMARAYALAATAQMIASPISGTLIVHEHVYRQILWDAARLVATVGSVWIARAAGASPVETIWILSAATALLYAINWEMCRRSVARVATG